MRRPFVGGNWKMNTNARTAEALGRAVAAQSLAEACDVAVFPPFVYLLPVGRLLREQAPSVMLGAQDVWPDPEGAFTGEISAAMLLDCGVQAVLVGHSERRHVVGDSDGIISRKVRATLASGMSCILCVGETIEQRERGETDRVNERQVRDGLAGVSAAEMARVTIAYEPVWAIGTGRTATPRDAQDAHSKIRRVLGDLFGPSVAEAVRIQYGGSMKASNAAELLAQPDVDGGLIGGASLKAEEFLAIVRAAGEAKRAR